MDAPTTELLRRSRADPHNRQLLSQAAALIIRSPQPIRGKPPSDWLAGFQARRWQDRRVAALNIRNFGHEATFAIPSLLHLLEHDRSFQVRQSAADVLAHLQCPAATETLLQAGLGHLEKPTDIRNTPLRVMTFRLHAWRALGRLKDLARHAAPTLSHALRNNLISPANVRAEALKALARIHPQDALQLSLELLHDTNDDNPRLALLTLAQLQHHAQPALPTLHALLQQHPPELTLYIQFALERIPHSPSHP